MTRTTPCTLVGGSLSPLDGAACDRWLAWLLAESGSSRPEDAAELTWLLAHCDDGVTWGRYDPAPESWRLGSDAVPDVSPTIRRATLCELRVFGALGEMLIWRTPAGLRGRVLRDTAPSTDAGDEPDPLSPRSESRILRGDRVVDDHAHAFTHVADRAGAEQVLPLTVSEGDLQARLARLVVRHFYAEAHDSGSVRVAATRLMDVGLAEKGAR